MKKQSEKAPFPINLPVEDMGKQKNYLLLIAIDDYQYVAKVQYAVRDAKRLRDILWEKYCFEKDWTIELYDEDASYLMIEQSLRYLSERIKPQDNLIIFFSGQGHFDDWYNEGYWLPIEAQVPQTNTYFPVKNLVPALKRIHSLHTLVIADAAYSGHMLPSTRSINAFENFQSRWILASGSNEVLPQGLVSESSPFVKTLLDTLLMHQEEGIGVSDLALKLKANTYLNQKQLPTGGPIFGAGDEGGEFLFHPKGHCQKHQHVEEDIQHAFLERAAGITRAFPSRKIKRTNHLFAIGINHYPNFLNLNNAVRDAKAICERLKKDYLFEEEHIFILTDKEATRQKILQQFRHYVQTLTPNDNLLIYYAGHGIMPEDLNTGFWVPTDGLRDDDSSWIENSTIYTRIREMKAHHVFLIADACFSGSFFDQQRGQESLYDAAPSRFYLSSGAKEPVSDGEPGKNSPFANRLLQFLARKSKASIRALELTIFAQSGNYLHEQRPLGGHLFFKNNEAQGEFIFTRRFFEKKNQSEDQAWEEAQQINTPAAYGKFAMNFPYSAKYEEAMEKIIELHS